MSHFAQLDERCCKPSHCSGDDTSDSNGTETESIGVAFKKLLGADTNWKQTSYNGNMRGNYADIGYTYMTNVATWVLVLLISLLLSNLMHHGELVPQQQSGYHLGCCTWFDNLTVAAGSCYEWNESAYQADNTVGWALTTPA